MNKKTYLKGAGVLLLTAVMLLSATAVTANTTNQISVTSPFVNSHNSGMSRDNVIYDNDIIDYTGIMSSQNDTTYGIVSYIADDFTLTATSSVAQIIWIGGYYNGGVYGGMDQRVIIYNDDGSGNKPGTILYNHMFPNAQTNETSLGGWYYSYEVSLPNPPTCNAGVKYWLCIQGEGNIAPQAGTAFHQTPINDHMADFKCTYFGFPDWTDTQSVLGYAVDTCFQLLGGTPEDNTPPVTTVGFSGTNPVTVTITATDDMSGVNHTYYNLDAAGYVEYNAVPFNVSVPGNHTIFVYSVDKKGNSEVPHSYPFTVAQPPITITIKKGLGITATIKNTGTTTLTNISWTIKLTGGIIIIGKSKPGTIATLAPAAEFKAKDFVLGFGKTSIAVTAGSATASASGMVILILVI